MPHAPASSAAVSSARNRSPGSLRQNAVTRPSLAAAAASTSALAAA